MADRGMAQFGYHQKSLKIDTRPFKRRKISPPPAPSTMLRSLA
jgi:hypothetical protein